ncbi:SAM-dependent methyltransferase [Alkalihalophilus pseudofirmus]|nr:SAM-dependent methyltransferase [Alkalihalophilus pseudofirmus]
MAGERFHPSKADKLIDPKRYQLIDPKTTIQHLNINVGDIVADLGAGNGFFTIPIAQRTKTQVYAVDIEPEMLELLKERAKDANTNNIEFVVSDLEEIKLDNLSVDKAFVSLVLHEVPSLDKALMEIKRILENDGQILLLEWETVESEMGPPLHERISSVDMTEALKKHGFVVEMALQKEAIYGLIGKLDKGE